MYWRLLRGVLAVQVYNYNASVNDSFLGVKHLTIFLDHDQTGAPDTHQTRTRHAPDTSTPVAPDTPVAQICMHNSCGCRGLQEVDLPAARRRALHYLTLGTNCSSCSSLQHNKTGDLCASSWLPVVGLSALWQRETFDGPAH